MVKTDRTKLSREIFDEVYDEIHESALRVSDDFWAYHSMQNAKMKKSGGEVSYLNPMVRRTADYTMKIVWVKTNFKKKADGTYQRQSDHIKKKRGPIYNMDVLLAKAPSWEHESVKQAENDFAFLRRRLNHLTKIGYHIRLYEELMQSKKVEAPDPVEF